MSDIPDLDRTPYSESLRRALYDAVRQLHELSLTYDPRGTSHPLHLYRVPWRQESPAGGTPALRPEAAQG